MFWKSKFLTQGQKIFLNSSFFPKFISSKMKKIHVKISTNYILIAIGSALGLGLSPVAPGTCGALLGVLFHVSIVFFLPHRLQLASLIIFFLIVCLANYLLTPWAEKYWDSEDPKQFVLDEVAGYILVPILFRDGQLCKVVLWGFLFFRVFDIFKLIPPAKFIDQKIHGHWGILLDDLVSAMYASLLMYFILWLNPSFFN